jgi:hypothetical protein
MAQQRRIRKDEQNVFCGSCEEQVAEICITATNMEGEIWDRGQYCRSCIPRSIFTVRARKGEPIQAVILTV